MARSSSEDPVDKFRFQVIALTNNAILNLSGINLKALKPKEFKKAGFTEATLPKATISEISYRENIDGFYFKKIPGLVKYDPVTLKRGVTQNQELYDWYTLANNDAASLNDAVNSLSAFGVAPFQSGKFRKDILISVKDRTGKFVKHWMLFNAFPISYKGGDDLEASTEIKLMEELVLTYESFLESNKSDINDVLEDISSQIAKAAEDSVAANVIGSAAGALKGF